MTWLERGWYQKSWWCYLLAPLSALFFLVSYARRLLFCYGLKKSYKLPVPVVIVGNISVGGTGKTPFTLWLCRFLREQGFTPGIISRGYGATLVAPRLVKTTDQANAVGDEPLLLAQRSGCPVVVSPDRVAAGRFLLEQCPTVDIIISDDGLQHYRLKRDLEIVLVDGQRGLGNGWVLPAGPLRETRRRLKHVDLVVANSADFALADGVMQLQVTQASALLPNDAPLLPPANVTLVAGIGNPQRFYHSAKQAGYQIGQQHFLPDHHAFTPADFSALPTPILMTEKDAVKCRSFAQPQWYFLEVQAQPELKLQQKLSTQLTNLRSRYGH